MSSAHSQEQQQWWFEDFFDNRVAQLEHQLQRLLSAPRDDSNHNQKLVDLIGQVLDNGQTYYREKERATKENALRVLSPTWLSSYENSLLWIAGWKPSMAFRVVNSNPSILQLSPGQLNRIEELKLATGAEERELSEDMAKLQEAMVNMPVLELARRARRLFNGEIDNVEREADNLMNSISAGMEIMVVSADRLRLKTVGNLVDILNSVQTVDFLAAGIQLFLRIHRWGQKRDVGGRTR